MKFEIGKVLYISGLDQGLSTFFPCGPIFGVKKILALESIDRNSV